MFRATYDAHLTNIQRKEKWNNVALVTSMDRRVATSSDHVVSTPYPDNATDTSCRWFVNIFPMTNNTFDQKYSLQLHS